MKKTSGSAIRSQENRKPLLPTHIPLKFRICFLQTCERHKIAGVGELLEASEKEEEGKTRKKEVEFWQERVREKEELLLPPALGVACACFVRSVVLLCGREGGSTRY